jgi:GTP-binding protein HflX
LLHVADASNAAVYDQVSAVYGVFEELGIEDKNTLLLLNKTDALAARGPLDGILNRYPNAIPLSAATGEGQDRLAVAVSDALSRSFRDVDVETGVENGRLMAYLAEHGEILSRRFSDSRVTIHCRLPQKYLGRIEGDGAVVRPHRSNHQSPHET